MVHYAYAGSLAETVCLAGDSAGGNLCLAVTLHANRLGIRAPDAVMPVYPALAMVMGLPSPSRVLSVMDPLISFGALVACFKVCALSESRRLKEMLSLLLSFMVHGF